MRCRNTFNRFQRKEGRGKTLHRIPSKGMIAGVCAGLAEYFHISRPGLRILFCLGALMTGVMPFLILYTILTFVLPVRDFPEDTGYQDAEEPSFMSREGVRQQRKRLIQSLNRAEQRVAKMESYLISSEYEWERKYRGL